MQLFGQTNIDWMGKAKYFFGLSIVLLLFGGFAIYRNGDLRYGIDFKGGTLVYVRFAEKPPIDQIRSALAAQGMAEATIQLINDPARPSAHEVVIGIEQTGEGDQALDIGKNAILSALHRTFGGGASGKPDLNATASTALAEFLTRQDPLALGTSANDRYTQLAARIISFRDSNRSGILTASDIRSLSDVPEQVRNAVTNGYDFGRFAVRNVEIVGPRVGAQLRRQAVYATLSALLGMLIYIAFRFEWVYGAAAVIAVFHDVLITLGLFTLFGYEITLTVVAALLTLVGYSMNDTIVIFDRVREVLRVSRREPLSVVVNRAINQTLSRTVLTSGLTLLTVLVLFLLGGPVLRGFAFALVVGIVVGTYSSFGIAAPIVVAWDRFRGGRAVVGTGNSGGGRAGKASDTAENRLATAARR